jgi:hypothetical protein
LNESKVRVDGEEVVIHITDQSVMFEKGGTVSGFERNAIRMVKPDGDAMVIAYSSGTEVKSVRVEPLTAVAPLLLPGSNPASTQTPTTGLDDVFERLYQDAREELEDRLAKVSAHPQDRSLRLGQAEENRYSEVSRQMEGIASARFRFDPRAEDSPISFWGLERQPYPLQLDVVKIRHIRFLRLIVGPTAEKSDVVYSSDEVWPEDWPGILRRFNLGSGQYTTEKFINYISYLKSNWKYRPGERKPTLANP